MRNAICNITVTYTSSLVGFLILMGAARMLGAQQFSAIAIGVAIGAFGGAIINLGNDAIFVRDAVRAESEGTLHRMMTQGLSMRVTIVVIVVLANLVGAVAHAGLSIYSLSIAVFGIWASLSGLYPAAWFDFKRRAIDQNTIVLAERLVALAVIVAMAYAVDSRHQSLVLGFVLLVSRIASIAVQLGIWWRRYGRGVLTIQAEWPKHGVGSVSLTITLAAISNALLTFGNQLLLGRFYDKAEISAYGLAFQVVCLILLFQSQLVRLFARSTADICREKIGMTAAVLRNAFFLALGSAVLALACWAGIRILPVFLDDPRFSSMEAFATVLCVWVVIVGVGQSITQALLALGEDRFYLAVSILGGIVAFMAGALYVPTQGGRAAALILLVVHSSMILLNLFRFLFIASSPKVEI